VTTLLQLLMSGARARRVAVLVAALVLALATISPLSRLRFDADVLHLMPRDTGAVQAFETYLERFGSLDALYVFVEAPEDHLAADYEPLVTALVERLRALPEVARVDAGPLDTAREWRYLTDRQLLLLDDARLQEALARLDPSAVPDLVHASRDLLVLGSPDVKALVQRDPLGWFDLLRPTLGTTSGIL
jgi:predicted RND superfamily exporter protein